MATNLRVVLAAINNVDTLNTIKRQMRLDIMKFITGITDPWVQAHVQRRHHIRLKDSPLKAAVFSKAHADRDLRFLKCSTTQAQKSKLAQYDRRLRLKEESYGLKMAKVS